MYRKVLSFLLFYCSVVWAANTERFIFKPFNFEEIAKESHPRVSATVNVAAKLVLPQPSEARYFFVETLRLAGQGLKIDAHDYLQAHYGLLKLARLGKETKFQRQTRRDYDFIAQNVLVFLEYQGDMHRWKETDFGMFKREAYKEAANRVAWHKLEDGKDLKQALGIIRRAKRFIDNEDDDYIYDTEVRILLKLKYFNRAYRIVRKVLKRRPHFSDFQDIKVSEHYRRWRR